MGGVRPLNDFERRQDRLRRLAAAALASRQIAEDDREARDAAIEEADRDGMELREIARCTNLHPSHIHHVITTRTAARQAALRRAL